MSRKPLAAPLSFTLSPGHPFTLSSPPPPRPGRYTLVLLLNGVEAAQRTLWFGPATFFRPPPAGDDA